MPNLNNLHREKQGKCLVLIPASSLPGICAVQGHGRELALVLQGALIKIEGEVFLEVHKIELK